jgi:hypothetical protein
MIQDRRPRDPWYRGTADGRHPEDGETIVPDHEPGSPEARAMASSIAAEIQHDPNFG